MPNIDTITGSRYSVLLAQSLTGTNATNVNSTGLELARAAAVEFVTAIGVATVDLSAALDLSLILEHSDDDVTYTAVTDSAQVVLGANASAPNATTGIFATVDESTSDAIEEDEKVYVIGYVGPKRYARVAIDHTGDFSTNYVPVMVIAREDNKRVSGSS